MDALTTQEKIDAARDALEVNTDDAFRLLLEACEETLAIAQAAAQRAGVPQEVEL